MFIFSRDKQGSEARSYQEKPLRIFKVIQMKITAQTMNYLREANIVVVSRILASEPCLPKYSANNTIYFCSFLPSSSTCPRMLPLRDIASVITLTECKTVE